MLATWPMVIGALAAGVLVGVLVPSPRQPSATGSEKLPAPTSSEKLESKAKRNLSTIPAKDSKPAAPAPDTSLAKRDSDACSQQTWPYYSASCLDRSTTAPGPVRVVSTRPADPSAALGSEQKDKQASAPQPARQAKEAAPPPPPPITNRAQGNFRQATPGFDRQVEQDRARQQPRGQARITRVQPPDNEDWTESGSPRVLLRRDGTRVYILPDSRHVRRLNEGYWRSW